MTKGLEERLNNANTALGVVAKALNPPPVNLAPSAVEVLNESVNAQSEIPHWKRLLETRAAALDVLTSLEKEANSNDLLAIGGVEIRFDLARFMMVQSYLTAHWSLADSIVPVAGRILSGAGKKNSLKLADILGLNKSKAFAVTVHEPFVLSFGWPIGLSYALRNHFFHDGASVKGRSFFKGDTPKSAFEVSLDGWKRIERRAKDYGVDDTCHRKGAAWLPNPTADLRAVLRDCETEMDDAMGTLLGGACACLKVQLAFVLGQD